MNLIKLWYKKNGRHQTKKYLLPLFTALCTAALIFTGCADSINSIDSSDGKKEKFTITVKTQNLTSKKEAAGRSIFPVLPDSEHYTLSYKSGETWQILNGTYPNFQMFINPGTYTLKLDAYSDEEKQKHILTGQTELTVTSGMENAEVPFILQPLEKATGNGSVSLILSAETDTQIETFEITADSGNLSLVWTKDNTETTYTKGTITAASVQSGTYHLTIYGKTTAGETIYVRSETLTVWSGLESSAWIFADGSSSNELKITASDLYSTFYVKGSDGPYNFYKDDVFSDVTASDTNSGNITSPLQTVSAAVNKCVVSGKPYTIYVDGTVNEVAAGDDPTAIEISGGKIITIKSIKPEGGKSVIQADGKGRVMFAGGTVILENLELKGGTDSKYGGGIFVSSTGALTMKNCTITGCNATTSGGGLYIASNGSANLSGCTISKCHCIGGGGGLYIASGVTATLIGCTIQANYTRDSTGAGSGGGILNSGTLNITDCKFISNNANCGGGIQTVGGGTVTIKGTGEDTCVFQSNKANSGGAIHTLGTVTAENVKFESNSSEVSNGGGGGLWIEGSSSNVTLTDCNLSNNTAANLGGAVWVSGGSLTLNGGTVSINTASNGGGGIYIASDVMATITDCTISGNSANGSGGGLKICSPAKLTNCTIEKNSADNGDGGGLECICRDTITQINVEFTNCKIISNEASNNGGGVSINSNVGATFTSCKIEGNTTTYNGGGLLLWHQNNYPDPIATLEDCTISSNTAGGSGGAIRTDGGELTLTLTGTSSGGGTKISGNTSSTSDAGKSIYLNSGYMNISGYIQITSDNPARLRTGRTTITGTLNGTTPVITVTPDSYTEGNQIVSAGSGVNLSDEVEKIAVTNDSSGTAWKVDTAGKLAKQ